MILTNIGLVLIALGTISVLIKMISNAIVPYHLTWSFITLGLLLFIIGVMTVKLKIAT